MKKRIFRKLNNTKGSSLPEALIGFLIAVLGSMILVGVVTTSTNIMTGGEEALQVIYREQQAFDIFVHHKYEQLGETGEGSEGLPGFKTKAGSLGDEVECGYEGTDQNSLTVMTFTDTASADSAQCYPEVKPKVAYCRAKKHNVFCFTTPPDWTVK